MSHTLFELLSGVQDESQHSEQTDREMGYGKQQRVTGVPHFGN